MTERAALIAVIGPAAHDLVAPFAAHYAGLGITELRVAVHLPTGTSDADRERLLTACRDAIGPPDIVSEGDWRVVTNGILRDRLRDRARADWHVLADADEFQFHPAGIEATIERCRAAGTPFATGLLLDRLTADGDPAPGASTPSRVDATFPLGCFLTAQVLDGDPRKVTLAHREVQIPSNGNHFASTPAGTEAPAPTPVHHFKWRAGVRDYLAQRARWFEPSPERIEQIVGEEALRAVQWLGDASARADVRLTRFPASLRQLPSDWEALATPVWRYWQVDRWRLREDRRARQSAR